MLVASPAAAQTRGFDSRSRVTGASRPTPSVPISSPAPAGAWTRRRSTTALKALIRDRPVPGRAGSPRPGGRIVVTVVENPVIGRVAFEGNKKIKDEQLSAEVQSKPRGTLSRPMVQSDAQRIAEIYRHSGRYDVTRHAGDHRAAEQPRRSGFRHHRRRQDRRQVGRVRRQRRLFVLPPEGHHQDARIQPAELPRRRRRLRSGPGRSRPRPDPSLLSEARLCRRSGGGRADGIRSGRRRASSSPSRSRKASSTASARSNFQSTIPTLDGNSLSQLLARQRRRGLQRRSAREVGRGDADRGLAPRLCLRDRAPARRPQFREPHRHRSPSPSTRARGPISSASTSAATPAPGTT